MSLLLMKAYGQFPKDELDLVKLKYKKKIRKDYWIIATCEKNYVFSILKKCKINLS
jgi:hypothetical protein